MSSSSESRRSFESISITAPNNGKYNVFLSFCATDAGEFVPRLYCALRSEDEIVVYGKDQRFQHGEQVESVLNVIGECRIAVVVFSENYASSSSCIKELEKITECARTSDLIVLPVFSSPASLKGSCVFGEAFNSFLDRVSKEDGPEEEDKFLNCVASISHATKCFADFVHNQGYNLKGNSVFGKAFHSFLDRISKEDGSEEEDKFLNWVASISHATKYFGSTDFVHKPLYRYENVYIKDIVEHVKCVMNMRWSFATSYTPSLKSSVRDVVQLLKQSKSPFLLGIWGMTGIGKSTIAQAIFGQIGLYFEHKCFLENVGGVWKNNDGLVLLQRKIHSHIDRPTGKKIDTSLQASLHRKRILLVLDNVDKMEQLHFLCRSREWFGKGSKIIITTRDRHLLKEHGVDHIYRVKELGTSESLEVLNRDPREDFVQVSRQLVPYCGGLPLALEALERLLRGKEILEWKGVLRSLQRFSIPAPRLLEALEKSFSKLSYKEAQIFLDIALFFTGMNQNDVLQTLNRSTHSAALLISRLHDKSFITIDENNKLQMPVLLQAMARYIIKRSSNNTDQPKIYDVFLSFRGDDSRAKFVSHLHSSLQNAGIYVFKDDDEIQRGDQISFSLLRAIGKSRISVVVLSTNYANSRWCMLELEKIMEIGRVKGLVVVPVFYEVDPSEVRHQKGLFGKAFEGLMSTISVDKSTNSNWRKDLSDIGGIGGFVLVDSRNESDDINNIVEDVTRLLDRTELFVAEHPVGVESRVQTVTKLLNIQKAEDVLFLGIWGMGGMGKTTIAKAIYNQIGSQFEGKSFLLNIREFWETDTNKVSLQQQVLCDVYKTTSFKIRDIESGKNILKQRLAQKRVLFVLDDVNELDQLNALCGSHEWFGSGSRIIITTRDMHLLRSCMSFKDQVHKIEEMDESESLELFSWHAFKQPNPIKDFTRQSSDVIAYSGRLPLALEVLGSYLYDCEITEWHKVLEKLKCIPHNEVQKKLRVSFDGLKEVTEQQIFLDIACFFIGMDQNDVIQILNACGFYADIGIKVLVERSLVTVDNKNKLRMHDLLRDMGRKIIYEESPFDPENRSRLWRREEVFDILSKQKGTVAVKGLTLESPGKHTVSLNTKAFKQMNKLRLLQLAGVQLKGDFKNLSADLRWLYWHGFPSTYTPAGFQQGSLVVMELKYSNIKQIWKKSQVLENLKILNLSHSRNLTETPDFSCLPNLEKLVLKDCPSLSKVSHSIGSLRKILLINLTDCTSLRKLPRSIYELKSLETLILSGCSMISKLEEDMEQMESLTALIADKTAITKVPFSIVRSKNIGYISLCGFEGFSHDVFPSIIWSWMSPSKNLISFVQTYVPPRSLGTFKDLPKLRSLCVECGSKHQLSRDVANILDVLKATHCHKLDARATTSQISDTFPSPLIDDCLGEVHTSWSKNDLKSFLIRMGTKCQVSNIAEDNILQTADATWDSFLPPCDNISDWLNFSCKGCSIIFDVPARKGSILKSMMLCVLYYSSPENIISEGWHGMLIINHTKTTIQVYKRDTLISFEDGDWQSITANLEPGNEMEVMVVFGKGFIVEKTTVSLLYDEPINQEMENCNAVDEEDVIVYYGHDEEDVILYGHVEEDVIVSDVPVVDNNADGLGQDENISENVSDSKNGDVVGKSVSVSGGCNIDVLGSKNVTGVGQDENIIEDKHLHAMDKNSGDDAMATDEKCACCFWWR